VLIMRTECSSVFLLLVTANVIPRSLIPFNLITKVIPYSDTSVHIRATQRHRRENLKSYIVNIVFVLNVEYRHGFINNGMF
jgi:hypothetical protein